MGGRAAKVLEKDLTAQAVSIAISRTILHVYVSLEEAYENTYIYTVSLRNARCLERTSNHAIVLLKAAHHSEQHYKVRQHYSGQPFGRS